MSSTSSAHASDPPLAAADLPIDLAARLQAALPNAVELAVLWSLAVAQPLLDVLGRYPEFFNVHGSTTGEVVAFGIAVVLLPPLLLWIAELALYAVGRRAGDAAHLVLVGGLTALLALRVVVPHTSISPWAALAVAAAAGAGASALYARHRAPRIFLLVLAPLPLVVAALFLFVSPSSALVTGDGPLVAGAPRAAPIPVVLVVFDEFPTVSLMNRKGRIDAVRYPSFGALAADSTWYRNATSVDGHTENAVPAILTGLLPREDLSPVYRDHRRNIFTLLGATHEIRAIDPAVHLCPGDLCPARLRPGAAQSLTAWMRAVGSDSAVVYLRGTLPARVADGLPDISTTWGYFGASGEQSDAAPAPERGTFCGRSMCDFAASIGPSARPRLYFLHTLLPHTPWVFLPDGKRYPGDGRRRPPGIDKHGRWATDPAPSLLGQQRHLLQVGYADLGLGLVLDALRRNNLYDDALIVVTADHGVNFHSGQTDRLVSPETIGHIAFVPLLVKLPGQTGARVDDRLARTIDILPTIADALGARIPWHVDGQSLLRPPAKPSSTVAMLVHPKIWVRSPLAQLLRRRAADLKRQVALFGDGPASRIFALGGERELRGRRVASLRVVPSAGAVAFSGGRVLHGVDPAGSSIPVYTHGTVSGARPEARLVITVNGVVAAVTRTWADGGAQRFNAVLDPRTLRAGTDRLDAYAVEHAGGSIVLHRLAPTG